ncbi:FkbM family methyltransferase [Rhizorhabdus dicambivorans]
MTLDAAHEHRPAVPFLSGVRRALRKLVWRVSRILYMHARGEETEDGFLHNGEARVIADLIRASRDGEAVVLLDVGANHGAWSQSVLDRLRDRPALRPHLCLTAFEPVTSSRQRLEAALASEIARGGITVSSSALSYRVGRARMARMSESGGTNSLEIDKAMEDAAIGFEEVDFMTLSAWNEAAGKSHIHMVKIDAEGHDARVIEGALPLLQAGMIDVLQFEYNHRWLFARRSLHDVFEMIAGTPYVLGRIRPSCVELHDEWHFELDRFFQCNYLLIHDRALSWFRTRRGAFGPSNIWEQF